MRPDLRGIRTADPWSSGRSQGFAAVGNPWQTPRSGCAAGRNRGQGDAPGRMGIGVTGDIGVDAMAGAHR